MAHDFNNLLAGIGGSLELANESALAERSEDVRHYLASAQTILARAAGLTQQLLAFTRRNPLQASVCGLNRLVSDMEDFVQRTVGPAIRVEMVKAPGLWDVLIDANQFAGALLNLCINARDAMPNGGALMIETGNRWFDEPTAREREVPPGQYVSLSVSDTGIGMSSDVIARAFDPFFTTKTDGLGTGFGLSMIQDFANNAGGQARIYSEIGKGAMVCLYFPRHFGAAEMQTAGNKPARAKAEVPEPIWGSGETVLVVEDEASIRMVVNQVLTDHGYNSIEAADARAGLQLLQSEAVIDLLVTDVGLPGGINGRQMAEAARQLRPDLKVLFITGYAENAVLSHGHLERGMEILTKPFPTMELASRVRELLQRQ